MHTVWIIKLHASNLTAVFVAISEEIEHFIPACMHCSLVPYWDRVCVEGMIIIS